MKHLFTLFFLAAGMLHLQAADTTRITSHNKVVIKTNPARGYTEYPARVGFPDDSVQYRKVYMYLEFGCAPGLRCGEWDYSNHVYLEKDSVRYEIARFITPYGFYWNSSQNWKHGWYFDLTDYSYLLHDSFDIIYQHSGYESNTDRGWTVTMDYYMVHGDAARIPTGIQPLYRMNAPYGNANNPFSNAVKTQNFRVPQGSDAVSFKILQTGHGMDNQENCAEFCAKKRTVRMDNNIVSESVVWRDDCGLNSLYPQAGTWIYDRAGWCPGAPVHASDIWLGVQEGSDHEFLIEMESYTNTKGGSANFDLSAYALFFKDKSKASDAAIEDIIAPSVHYDYLRMNPTCGAPVIQVRNMGHDTITRLEFEYGKLGGKTQKIWVPCSIRPFENGRVTLEAIWDWSGAGNTFFATITKVNDREDEYKADNTLYSKISSSQVFPNKIIIVFKSNNAPSENYYTLKDARGKIIRSKNNFAANTLYRDTVQLDNNVCYTFEFFDDGPGLSSYPLNRDGLDWWANSGDGAGYIQIRNGNNNTMLKNFNSDFGTKHLLNFMSTYSMGLESPNSASVWMEVIPNPSEGQAEIVFEKPGDEPYKLVVYDNSGRQIALFSGAGASESIRIGDLAPGLYSVSLFSGQTVSSRKFVVQ